MQDRRRDYIEGFMKGQPDGGWLLRWNHRKKLWIITLRYSGSSFHLAITKNQNQITLNEVKFDLMTDLLNYYSSSGDH
eukprot:Awhi_evm3s14618